LQEVSEYPPPKGCKFVYYNEETYNYSKALNLAVPHLKHPVALICSSHSFPFINMQNVVEIINLVIGDLRCAGVALSPSNYVDPPFNDSKITYNLINHSNFNGYNALS
jgi:hypothetical protein